MNRANNRKSDIIDSQQYRDFLALKYMPVWMIIFLLWLITRLPFSVQMAFGRLLGVGAYFFIKSRRRITKINIALCFPELSETEQDQLVLETFKSYGQGTIESAYSWLGEPKKLKDKIHFKGLEHIEQARKDGRGILMVGGHFSILDFAGGLLGLKEPYYIVQRHHENALFNYFMTTSRMRHASGCIGRKDLRSMIKTLRNGDILWYAPDQDLGRKNSVFAPFFNIDTATITGTSKLASLSNAVVIPVFYYRDKDKQYHIEFSEPLPIPSGDDTADAVAFNQWLESKVRRFPSQYFWLHKRFKTRPVGEASFYKKD